MKSTLVLNHKVFNVQLRSTSDLVLSHCASSTVPPPLYLLHCPSFTVFPPLLLLRSPSSASLNHRCLLFVAGAPKTKGLHPSPCMVAPIVVMETQEPHMLNGLRHSATCWHMGKKLLQRASLKAASPSSSPATCYQGRGRAQCLGWFPALKSLQTLHLCVWANT